MREIKFRAWDRKQKRMVCFNLYSLKNGFLHSDFGNHTAIDKCIVMLFTGLKDKNGKECYWDDWVTDGINPTFLVTPDYCLLARLSEIEFEIVGNKYETT